MTNLEYYKDGLRQVWKKCTSTNTTELMNFIYAVSNERSYCFNTDMSYYPRIIDWMVSEHIESRLTESEIRYLNNIITPFKSDVANISKVNYVNKDYIRIVFKNLDISDIDIPIYNNWFTNLELNIKYELKSLGLIKEENVDD